MLPRLSLLAVAISGIAAAAELPTTPTPFDSFGPSQSDFGGVGLLQMPTARMAKTGEFSFNYMDNQEYRRWSLSLQPFDWLEGTLRYTDTRTKLYSGYEEFSGDQTYKDKGFDVKIRLWQESRYIPQIAVGVHDIMGTGLFDGEYVVATKRAGALDFTLGMGWGNLGESGNIDNPFCEMSDDWCQRNDVTTGSGGEFDVKSLFHGPAALFGGIEYQTPWKPLRLKLEYDGNDYSNEFAYNYQDVDLQDSPWNFGAVYSPADWVDLHLSYQRGNTLMFGMTMHTNFDDLKPFYVDAPKAAYQPQQQAETLETVDWPKLNQQLKENAGFRNTRLYTNEDELTVIGEQRKYRDDRTSAERAGLLAANALPTEVKRVRLVDERLGLIREENLVDLDSVRHANSDLPLGQTAQVNYKDEAPQPKVDRGINRYTTPKDPWSFGWAPELTQSFGGPESFYMYQFGINGTAEYQMTKHDWLSATLYLNLFDNYDEFNYTTPPQDGEALPRVRTWIREYVTSSPLLLNNLQYTHLQQLAPEWHVQGYAGYLEMMYAGVGGEVLYRPYGKSWALGADLNWVRQRDWNNTLKLADYEVATGNLTAYWDIPYFEGLTAKVSAGQYLAEDVGFTVDLSKEFESGIVVGAFATKTDVSAEEYGEGSFTKGFYITFPFDLMLLHPTNSRGTVSWVPLTRDGGQMLSRKYSLYGLTSD